MAIHWFGKQWWDESFDREYTLLSVMTEISLLQGIIYDQFSVCCIPSASLFLESSLRVLVSALLPFPFFLNSLGPPSLSRLFQSSTTFIPCTSPPSTFQPFFPISTFLLFPISCTPITLDLNRLVPLIPHAFVCLSSSSYLYLSSPSSPCDAHTSLSPPIPRPSPAPVKVLCPQALVYQLNTQMARNHEEDVNFL